MKQQGLNREGSYQMMYELKKSLRLHSYTYRNKDGELKALVLLNYITADDKVHQIAETEITL